MERTKLITYQSCDLCDDEEEASGKCDICGKYLCEEHYHQYPWLDQVYQFCPEHYETVRGKIEATGIPIGFVVERLRGNPLSIYAQQMWDKLNYEALWHSPSA